MVAAEAVAGGGPTDAHGVAAAPQGTATAQPGGAAAAAVRPDAPRGQHGEAAWLLPEFAATLDDGPQRALSRRVTFSDDHMVHQLSCPPSRTSSSGADGSGRGVDGADNRGCWEVFKLKVKALKRDILALHLAVRDPRTPWVSKLLPWVVLAYALSPLDLMPDFIPVLGLLDDMLLLPLGLWLSYKLIPAEVMEDSRARAAAEPLLLERTWPVAVLVFCAWTALLLALVHWLVSLYGPEQLRQYEWAVLAGAGGLASIAFSVWLVSRIRYEARRRDEWSTSLLGAAAGGEA